MIDISQFAGLMSRDHGLAVIAAGRSAGQQFKDNLNDGSATQSQQAASFLQGHFPSQAGDVAQVVLMPSVLQLMGRANWWFPGWLERVVPSFLSEVRAEPRARGAGG